MNNNETKLIAEKILEENGIILYPDALEMPLDMDSLTFISVIVGLENELKINVSDQLLTKIPQTYSEFSLLVESIISDIQNQDMILDNDLLNEDLFNDKALGVCSSQDWHVDNRDEDDEDDEDDDIDRNENEERR